MGLLEIRPSVVDGTEIGRFVIARLSLDENFMELVVHKSDQHKSLSAESIVREKIFPKTTLGFFVVNEDYLADTWRNKRYPNFVTRSLCLTQLGRNETDGKNPYLDDHLIQGR